MIRFIIFFLIISPTFTYSQLFLDNAFSSPFLNNIAPHICISTNMNFHNTFSLDTPSSIDLLINLFNQKKYTLFLKEKEHFLIRTPNNIYSNELLWLEAHSLLKNNAYDHAKSKLLKLISLTNLQLKHRALFDLAQITLKNKDIINTRYYLEIIHKSSLGSPYKELAHKQLIDLALLEKKKNPIQLLIQSFEFLYPNSIYLTQIQYLFIINKLRQGYSKKAKKYANEILQKKENPTIRRILAEINLMNSEYQDALLNLLPLTKTINPFQEEALFKSALLYKMSKEYSNSFLLLSQLTKYFKNSIYYNRGLEELADINILLKNYDDALMYFLYQSGFNGVQKATALLKITEIYFLRGKIRLTRQTAERIQRDFPYSSYANEALYWLGRTYISDKQFQKSINIFDTYLIREPQSYKRDEIQIFLGHAYANLNNQAKARYYFQQILNNSTNNFLKRNSLLGLGRSYNLNEPKRSLKYFDQIWITWPDSIEASKALYYSGATRYNLRINKESYNNFTQLINDFPNSQFYEDSVLALAKLAFKSEDFNGILQSEDISLTTRNRELVSEFKELQARSFFRNQDYENALLYFKDANSLTTNQVRKTELFLAEASTLRDLGKYSQAVKKYERYLHLFKKENELHDLQELLWSEIAWSYIEADLLNKAQKTIEYIKDKFPKSIYLNDIYFKIADEFFVKKKYNDASKFYEKVYSSSKDKDIISDALLRQSWSLYNNKAKNTRDIIKKFITLYPNHHAVPDLMVKLIDFQDYSNSLKLRKKIISQFPNSPEAENARLYFLDLAMTMTIDELEKLINNSKDQGLLSKYYYQLTKLHLQESTTNQAIINLYKIHDVRDPILGVTAAFDIAQHLNNQKKYTESLKLYVNIIASYNSKFYPQALDKIIQNYVLLYDYNNAEKFKKRLLQQFPDSKEAKKWL